MKPNGKKHIALFLVVLSMLGCASLKGRDKQASDNLQMYKEGKGREDMTLSILRPAGIGLFHDEEKYLDIIQGALNSDFGKFSAIQLFDSKNLDTILEQQQLSLSGHFSESDYIRIGELVQSRYFLAGDLARVDSSNFNLYLSISDKEKGVILCAFTKTVSLKEIINSKASRAAVASLLPELGVVFTPAGQEALKEELSAEETEARTALALSYEASRSGNLIDALIYSYTATSADKNSAAAREQAASAFKMMGGEGTKIIEDIKRQQYWKDNLLAYENFYRNHPPFELVYTSKPVMKGAANYDQLTVDFEFVAGLRHRNVKTMQKVLNDILKELQKTDYKKNQWGFNRWPEISAASTRRTSIPTDVFEGYRTFTVRAVLLNNREDIVATAEFPLYGQLLITQENIIQAASTQERRVDITVKSSLITDDMQIRVISINGTDAVKSNVDAYIKNFAVEKLPIKSAITISKNNLRTPELPEDKGKRIAAEAKVRDKQAKWNAKPLQNRFNINAMAMYNPLLAADYENALAFEGGVGLGIKNISLDGRLVYSYDSILNKKMGEIYGLGLAAGYSFVWRHFLLSFEGGGTWYKDGSAATFLPLFETKLDMVPGKKGLAFRLAYKMEFGKPDPANLFLQSYFAENNSFGSESLRIVGNPSVGIVLWF